MNRANRPVKNIVIVGGGTSGWMAAAAISDYVKKLHIIGASVTVIESSDIASVGVGEATIPNFVAFNQSLGIDEIELIKATHATFKLGIQFENWHRGHDKFFHPFADYGMPADGVDFYQYFNHYRNSGSEANLGDYCFAAVLASKHNFAQPHPEPANPLADYAYAFHFDAALYAQFLKRWCLNRSVTCLDAKVEQVKLAEDDGFISSLILSNGKQVSGDLFIDCSGFKGVLIEQALHVGYEDWSQYLFCDSAIAVQSEPVSDLAPYTRAIAKHSGWQWQIPLQHRIGNGYIYASGYQQQFEAEEVLLGSLTGELLSEPRKLSFTPGRRKKIWSKNCFALGLASGFLEPLESTSISLVQTAIAKLLTFFPLTGFDPADEAEVNRLHNSEVEHIRDFLILHYALSQRDDTPFWRDCSNISLPETLAHKLAVFKSRGHIVMHECESFEKSSWLTLYEGFQIRPDKCDPRAEQVYLTQIEQRMLHTRQAIERAAEQAISHQSFIDRHCKAASQL